MMAPGHVWVEGPCTGSRICRNCLREEGFTGNICPAASELTMEAWP